MEESDIVPPYQASKLVLVEFLQIRIQLSSLVGQLTAILKPVGPVVIFLCQASRAVKIFHRASRAV